MKLIATIFMIIQNYGEIFPGGGAIRPAREGFVVYGLVLSIITKK